MICKQCNTLNESGDKFCFKCGAPLISESTENIIPVVNPEVKKNVTSTIINVEHIKNNTKKIYDKHKKKFVIGFSIIFVAFVLLPLIGNLISSGGYEFVKESILVKYNSQGYPSAVVSDEKVIELDDDDYNVKVSFSGNVAAYLSSYGEEGSDLVVISKGEDHEVDDEVMSFKISNDGSKIIYVKSTGTYNIGDLYSYDVSSKKSDKIDEDVYKNYLALSPNGKSIMYLGDVDEDDYVDEDCTAYLSVNGNTPKEVRDNFIPVAITDKGKLQYGFEFDDGLTYDGEFIVYKGKKATEFDANYNEIQKLSFSSDMNEVMYSLDNETRISENAKESVKVSKDSYVSILTPYDTKFDYISDYYFTVYVFGIDSFKNKVLYGQDLTYIDRKYDTHKIAKDIYNVAISKNGKELIALDDKNNLERIDINKGKSKTKEIAEDVYTFEVSKDLKYVYFLDEDEDLNYIKGNSKAKKVEKDVSNFTVYKNMAYIISDSDADGGTLSISKSGREPKEIKEADDQAYEFFGYDEDIYVVLKQDDMTIDLYKVSDSGKINRVSKDLDI